MSKTDGHRPGFELIQAQEQQSFRWFTHDFPHPLAQWHYHPEFEIHLIQSGTGKALVGDYIGSFHSGTLMMIGPNLPHNWVSDLPAGETITERDILVQFSGKLIQQSEAVFPELRSLNRLLEASRLGVEFVGETAETAAAMLKDIGNCRGAERVVRFFQLLDYLSRSEEQRLLASSDYIPALELQDLDKINRAIQYIFDHYDREVRLTDVADRIGMSDSAFSRFFKKCTGHNFVPYLNQLRINQACMILMHEHKPISTVCFEVGFNNLSNFNRTFIRQKGVTPTEFRERHSVL